MSEAKKYRVRQALNKLIDANYIRSSPMPQIYGGVVIFTLNIRINDDFYEGCIVEAQEDEGYLLLDTNGEDEEHDGIGYEMKTDDKLWSDLRQALS